MQTCLGTVFLLTFWLSALPARPQPAETMTPAPRYSAAGLAPEDRPGGKDWPQYCREFHTSDVELGALAARIQPKLLILDHTIRFGASDKELLGRVRTGGYAGKAVVGKDLDRF